MLSKLSRHAQEIKEKEDSFFLNKVDYSVFWGQVKLVGYTMQLRPEHMRSIQNSINLDYEQDILTFTPNDKKALICD